MVAPVRMTVLARLPTSPPRDDLTVHHKAADGKAQSVVYLTDCLKVTSLRAKLEMMLLRMSLYADADNYNLHLV